MPVPEDLDLGAGAPAPCSEDTDVWYQLLRCWHTIHYTPRAIVRAVRCGVRTIEHGNLVDREAESRLLPLSRRQASSW